MAKVNMKDETVVRPPLPGSSLRINFIVRYVVLVWSYYKIMNHFLVSHIELSMVPAARYAPRFATRIRHVTRSNI